MAEISAEEDGLDRPARPWGAAAALLEAIEVIAYPHAADRTSYDRQMAAGGWETGHGRQGKKAGR